MMGLPARERREWVPADTSLDAYRVQVAILRRLPASRHLEMALRMSDSIRELTCCGVRNRHPEYNEKQVRQSAIQLSLGKELFGVVSSRLKPSAMTQEEFLIRVAQMLETAGIPFMLAGSQSSSFHGEPRATRDVDLVIDPAPQQLDQFLGLLGEDYYASPEAAHEALARRTLFNIIDFQGGWKADLIIRKDRPFSVEEFRRRQTATIHGHAIAVATPEDVILSKLEWHRITPSEQQLKDALNVATVKRPQLDRPYLNHWAAVLGVADLLTELLRQADELSPPEEPSSGTGS